DVVELFLTRDPSRAHSLALKLEILNQERRHSETRALDSIDQALLTLIQSDGAYPAACIILDHPDWHRGVLGILASRVVDRTGRPALILTHAEGDAHGSGRSIDGFHLLDAIAAADAYDPAAPLFHRFGGHAHAVGFSLPSPRLALLRELIHAYAASHLTAPMLIPQLDYDAEIAFADLTLDLFTWVERCAPFGMANQEPIFLTRNATLAAPVRLIQEKHVCLQLTQPNHAAAEPTSGPPISALGWSRGATNWPARCTQLSLAQGSSVDILYRIRRNTGPYGNRQLDGLELELCALRPSTAP
ncbi:MAG TPA: DHHA1 domain-containing protein, partial [Acidobacteriaceae bacterium]|nr:DHHA1 domain-containing protein [Acidobacteriaceae bacterium]